MNQLFLVRCLKSFCMDSESVQLKGLAVLLPHILRACSDVWVNPMISSRNEVLEYLNNVDTLKILSCYCNAYSAQHTIWLNSVTQIQMPLPHILCPCSQGWIQLYDSKDNLFLYCLCNTDYVPFKIDTFFSDQSSKFVWFCSILVYVFDHGGTGWIKLWCSLNSASYPSYTRQAYDHNCHWGVSWVESFPGWCSF